MRKKINFDYLNLWKEIFLFWRLVVKKKRNGSEKPAKILIVNPCLIGEFAASMPAISDFIKRNKDKIIDIVVSPPLKTLAEKIIGVRNVFIAQSVYKRKSENFDQEIQNFDTYEQIIFLRISRDSYNLVKKIKADKIKANAWLFSKYAFHLLKSVIFKRTPRQWGELNFELLGGAPRNIAFEEIFNFKNEDYDKIKKLEELRTTEKKIIIHTGSNWPMKKWNNEKWAELIQRIHALGNFRFIFVGIKDDEGDYAHISSKLGFRIYSLVGKINLMELMLVLRASDYFIGVDSGPKNMAYLADVRSIAILGPGPHFFMPANQNHAALTKSNGRGLYQMFFCKKNNFIEKITVDDAYKAFIKLIC